MISLPKYLDEMEGCEVRAMPPGILQAAHAAVQVEFMEITFQIWTASPVIGQDMTITGIDGKSSVWKVAAVNPVTGNVLLQRPKKQNL